MICEKCGCQNDDEEAYHLSDNPFAYLKYVPLGDAWQIIKEKVMALIGIIVVVGLFAFASKWIGTWNVSLGFSAFTWMCIIYFGLSWLARGERLAHRFPKYSFGAWTIVNGGLLVLIYVVREIRGFGAVVVIFSGFIVCSVVSELNEKGYNKYLSRKSDKEAEKLTD